MTTTTNTINKSTVMKAAHSLVREQGGYDVYDFSRALRAAWAFAKDSKSLRAIQYAGPRGMRVLERIFSPAQAKEQVEVELGLNKNNASRSQVEDLIAAGDEYEQDILATAGKTLKEDVKVRRLQGLLTAGEANKAIAAAQAGKQIVFV
jgi:hypothetical protein